VRGRARTADLSGTPDVRLLGPVEVRALADRLDLRPTKQRGQNFVIDANTVRRIVRASGVGAADTVLEVGPGLGSLTLALLERARGVVAVEVDADLAAALPQTLRGYAGDRAGDVHVVHADALALAGDDVSGWPVAPTALVANLPYNVSVPVLLHLLRLLPSVRHGLVMVQAEVADRLAAPPGSRTYGVPSVKAAWYADVRPAGRVSRTVFWPAPNVDSGLVSWVRRDPPVTTASREQVFTVVDAAFAQRRKMLRSALAGLVGSASAAAEVLRRAGVPDDARGEQLDVAAFAAVAQALDVGPR
jgi:16S rRNA (adenine1518-N6/adenine1519-N6)-dimethyltransferase